MIGRTGSGWQYALADLSLILFMITAAALAQAGEKSVLAQPSPQGEVLAVWRDASDAPPLGEWLATQTPDPRQQLTIVVHYGVARYDAGGQDGALDAARGLAALAGEAGAAARIIVEPGAGGVVATLAYDVPAQALARGLPDVAATPSYWSRP